MTGEQRKQIEDLFDRLLQLSPASRHVELDRLCPDDHQVREEVMRLLVGSQSDLSRSDPTFLQNFRTVRVFADGAEKDPLDSQHVGPYLILEKLGDGGFGTVYKARQMHPVKRLVAIKVIKLGFDTRQVIARFEAERQALARMDHPNIATVLDAGMTDSGRPFFAMEYVDGVAINVFADEFRLSIKDRLLLFLEICDAIAHAHQKAIIHRDIKANNVLGFMRDGRPHVKVIDFGIAKALSNDPLTETALHTTEGQPMGTYGSMSPEQVQGSVDIDTRSDVYSLGVLLYELLCGAPPFDREFLSRLSQTDLLQTIGYIEPPTPCDRLLGLGNDARRVAENRRANLETLTRQLSRELEWIPLKAMRKERARRYSSSQSLAEDVQNYLDGKPLTAGPESTLYLIRKALRRHIGLVGAVAAILIVLTLGILATTIEAIREKHAQGVAQDSAAQAIDAEKKAQTLADENSLLAVERGKLAEKASKEAAIARHQLGVAFLERAKDLRDEQDYFSSVITAAYAIGFASDPGPSLAEGQTQTPLDRGASEYREAWDVSVVRDAPHLLWRTPAGALHDGPVRSVAFSKDGTLLASGSDDHRARIWNVRTGALLQTMDDRVNSVLSLSLNPDASLLATASANAAHIWNASTGELLRTLYGHEGPIRCLAFSPNTNVLATCSDDQSVRLWDAASGSTIAQLAGHTAAVLVICFSADGRTLASAASDRTIRLWDAKTHQLLRRIDIPGTESDSITFSPDYRWLASCCKNQPVSIWDVHSAQPVQKMAEDSDGTTCLCFSPNGAMLAGGSDDHQIRLWDSKSGKLIKNLTGNSQSILSVSFSPDGKIVASGHADNGIGLWDIATGTLISKRDGHEDIATCVCFSPNGRTVVSASRDANVRLWNARTGELLRSLQFPAATSAQSGISNSAVAFSPDGKSFAGVCGRSTISAWDSATFSPIWTKRGNESSSGKSCASFSPDGNILATSWVGNAICLLNARTGESLRTLSVHTAPVTSVSFSPDGKTLASGSDDRNVQLWNVKSGQPLRTLVGHTREVSCVAFSPDNVTLASSSIDGTIRLWNCSSGELIRTFQGHMLYVTSVSFSADGKELASGSADSSIRIWDTVTGQLLQIIRGSCDQISSVSFSPDGRSLAAACWDSTVSLWRIAPDDPLPSFVGHTHYIDSVAFSPNGHMIASGSYDRTACLWDLGTGKPIRKLAGHALQVYSVDFSRDGSRLCTASEDNTARIWNTGSGELVRTFQASAGGFLCAALSSQGDQLAVGARDNNVRIWNLSGGDPKVLISHTNGPPGVYGVSFAPNGKTLATAMRDGTVKFWDVGSGALLKTLTGHLDRVASVRFSPDGQTIASGSYDGSIRLWKAETGELIWSTTSDPRNDARDGVTCVRFSPDGKVLASGSRDGNVRIWDTASGIQLQSIRAVTKNSGSVFGVDFSPDGKILAAGSDDNAIHLWMVRPNVPLRQYLRLYQFDGLEMKPLPPANLYVDRGFTAQSTEFAARTQVSP